MYRKTLRIIVLMALVAISQLTAADKPLKIYILAGQSNMQGKAQLHTIPRMALDPKTKALHDKIVAEKGEPKVHTNVSIVYFTGGVYSPFSFLYLPVIAVAAVMMRGGGLIFAGVSAVAYGLLVDLMVFEVLPVPDNLTGIQVALPTSRVLIQLLTNVVGFVLLAVLVSYLGESLRSAHSRLQQETERTKRFVALTDHVVRSVGAGIVATDLNGKVLHLNPAGARILDFAGGDSILESDVEDVIELEDHSWGLLKTRARAQAGHDGRSAGRREQQRRRFHRHLPRSLRDQGRGRAATHAGTDGRGRRNGGANGARDQKPPGFDLRLGPGAGVSRESR